MHVFTLFPHIIVFCNNKLSPECADSCKFVSYSKVELLLGGGGGGGVLSSLMSRTGLIMLECTMAI